MACGLALIRRSPLGASAASSGISVPPESKSSSAWYERIHDSSCARCPGSVRASAIGTWCARQVPSTGSPSTTLGPVHPLGVFSTMAGQAGRVRSPSCLARR